jgi:plastocyanin
MTLHRRAFSKLLTAAGVATAVGSAAQAQAKTVEVEMKQGAKMIFDPQIVTINAGDTISWSNPSFVTHTVTFDPGKAQTASDVVLPAGVAPFDSGSLEQDQTFTHQFTVKGTYKYVCKFHEAMGMVGTVIVN